MIIKICDVETTGLASTDEVCQLGWCDLVSSDGGGWEVRGGGEAYCKTSRPIPAEASAVHHIIDSDLVGAIPFPDLCQELFTGGEEIVACAAYNNRFDAQWLTPEMVGQRHWIDVYRAALWLYPEAPSHKLQALRYWLKPAGLDRAVARAHSAYGDAYVAAFLLRDMLSLTSGKQLVAWSKGPALLPRFTFGKWAMKPLAEVEPGYLEWILKQDMDEDVKFTARHWLERHDARATEAA